MRLTTALVVVAAMGVSLLGVGAAPAAPTVGPCPATGSSIEAPVVCAGEFTGGTTAHNYTLNTAAGIATGDTLVMGLKPATAPATTMRLNLTDAQANNRTGDCVHQNLGDVCNTSAMGNGAWTVQVQKLTQNAPGTGHYVLAIGVVSSNVGDPTQSCEGGTDAANTDAAAANPPGGPIGTSLNPILTTYVCNGRLGPQGGVADPADWYQVSVATSTAVAGLAVAPQSGMDTKAVIKQPNGNTDNVEVGGAGQPDVTPATSLNSTGNWKFGAVMDGLAPAESRQYTLVVSVLAP